VRHSFGQKFCLTIGFLWSSTRKLLQHYKQQQLTMENNHAVATPPLSHLFALFMTLFSFELFFKFEGQKMAHEPGNSYVVWEEWD